MSVEVKITRDRAPRLPKELREVALKVERRVAEMAREEIERTAPQHEENRIGKSARVEEHPRKAMPEVWVGLGGYWAYLGRFHEFGTRKMPAHPFVTPAAEHARQDYPERLSIAINSLIEED